MPKIKNTNFIVCTMVYPRYEWPFIYDWILYYNKLGINNFLIGIDKTGKNHKLKGTEKLKHKYYHLDKSDNEVNNLFFNEILKIKKINNNINIFTIDFFYSDIEPILKKLPVIKKNTIFQVCQTLLHKFSFNYGKKNNVNYIINIDVDEYIEINKTFKTIDKLFKYLEKKYKNIEVFYIFEYLCSGRFDENGNYRKVKDIETQNKIPTNVVKWIAKPNKKLIHPKKKTHTVHKALNTKNFILPKREFISYNHYRGYKNWTDFDYYNDNNLNKQYI